MENKVVLQNELFYCEHLTDSDEVRQLIDGFTVTDSRGKGLVQYLQKYALKEELAGQMRTYLVRDVVTNELVGYFSLKAGMASANERRFLFRKKFDTVSGIELANFAVNNTYKKTHEKYNRIGAAMFYYFIIPIIKKIAERVGARILYVFALPHSNLIEYYRTLGFERLSFFDEQRVHRRMKPNYDRYCIFMYQLIDES